MGNMNWLHDRLYGNNRTPDKKTTIPITDFISDYDHRWDDHPSWYTDNKAEQRKMIQNSIAKKRQNWD
jgi:hypothetical protein